MISFSQIEIKGTVYYQKGPLEGAAVYLNSSMLGTITNTEGKFSLPIKEGQYDLVVSFLGYETIIYKLNTLTYNKPLIFTLKEKEDVLDEIIIKKTLYDDNWKYNLTRFKREFIGITKLSKDCVILNPKTLYFDYNSKEKKLTAFTREPLKIRHKGLGYLITYDLVDFTIHGNYVSYVGYSRYENLKGNKRKQKRWKKNRIIAYKGSQTHFFKSVLENKIYEEGFIVNQFKRLPNKERPTEKQIRRAKIIIRNNKRKIDFSRNIITPKTSIDSALLVVRKSRLPKFKDFLYKTKVQQPEIISLYNNLNYLNFKDNLIVIYTKEKEELGYIRRRAFSKKRTPNFQTSQIIPLKRPSEISKNGTLYSPLDVFYEGYWSYEKFGNSLPLDYLPPKE